MKLHNFLSISLAIPLVSTLMLSNTPKAQAGCGWLDPTCRSGPNDCLFGACPRSTDDSTIPDVPNQRVKPSTTVKPPTRVDDSTYYDFQISNSTNTIVSFVVSDKRYTLAPNTKQDFHHPRTQENLEYRAFIKWPGPNSKMKFYMLPYPNYDANYTFTLNDAGETILKGNSGEVIDQSS